MRKLKDKLHFYEWEHEIGVNVMAELGTTITALDGWLVSAATTCHPYDEGMYLTSAVIAS